MIKKDLLNLISDHYNKIDNSKIDNEINFCCLSGLLVNKDRYITYKSGQKYLWKYFEKYINFIFEKYEPIVVKKDDESILLKINNMIINFDLKFNKSFHSYVDNNYPKYTKKYLIYGTYSDVLNTKPYFRKNDLKILKNQFKHGDIVYTGDYYYILNAKNNKKKTWKLCDTNLDDILTIPYNYIQERGYLYYTKLNKYFNTGYLPLDNNYDEYINLNNKDIYSNNPENFCDDDVDIKSTKNSFLDINKDENKDNDLDNLNKLFGKVVKINNEYYILIDENNKVLIENNIARQFIKIRGYIYYHNICKDFDLHWKCLVSPFEVLNLNNLEIKFIKLN